MNIVILLVLVYIWGISIKNDPKPAKIAKVLLILGFMMWRFGVEIKMPIMREISVAVGFIVIYYLHPMISPP